jgi:hypothetical protein
MVLRSLQSFGEGNAESDSGLSDFFIETPSYKGIENQRRLVVVGRKGAGKTAIYSMLLERAEQRWSNFLAVGLGFEDYPWHLHDAACPNEMPTNDQYASLWQFLILVETSKLVLRKGKQRYDRSARRARRRLKRFIKRNWGSVDAKVSQMFARSVYNLTLEPSAFGFKLFSLKRENVPREELASSLTAVNGWLREVLVELVDPASSYFVLLDDLDDGFDASNPAANSPLVGLLLAAREVRNWAAKKKLQLTPVVFMRSDIYSELRFPSKNKITEIHENIAWSEFADDPASLKTLIDRRIRAALPFETEDPWREVFTSEMIDGLPLYAFMASRTHRRPRDMIKLANLSLARANSDAAQKIARKHVEAALPAFSKYLLGEVADPAHQLVPEWREHVMTIKRLGRSCFSRADFRAAHEASPSDANCDHVLEHLYVFGVIGYVQGDNIVYAHHDDDPLDAGASHYEVHPGLRPALLSVSTNGRGATENAPGAG